MKFYKENGKVIVGDSVFSPDDINLQFYNSDTEVIILTDGKENLYGGLISGLTTEAGAAYGSKAVLKEVVTNKGLKTLAIVNNASEAVKVEGERCAIRVTTTAASNITIQRSIDGVAFFAIPDISWAVNSTTDEINLADIVPGQFLKVVSSGAMTVCKILQ